MGRATRVIQFILIGLGFIAFGLMFLALHMEGPDYGFYWSCGQDGKCVGKTSETPSGFHDAVTLGLLGIGFQVAAVAIGVKPAAATPAAANASTAPQPGFPPNLAPAGMPQMTHGVPAQGSPAQPGQALGAASGRAAAPSSAQPVSPPAQGNLPAQSSGQPYQTGQGGYPPPGFPPPYGQQQHPG